MVQLAAAPNPRWPPAIMFEILNDFVLDSRCLLSAESEPHPLPACLL